MCNKYAQAGMTFVALFALDSPTLQEIVRQRGDRSDVTASSAARAVILGMVVTATASEPDSWSFIRENTGRLLLASRRPDCRPPAISLAHSGNWIACAVNGDRPVGIDIERHRPGRDFAGMAAASFSPAENIRAAAGGMAAFYRIWTLREAVAKATGIGFAQVVDRQDYGADGPETGNWTIQLRQDRWSFTHICPTSDLSLAIAVKGAGDPVPIQWWHPPVS